MLGAMGLSLGHLARTVEFVSPAARRQLQDLAGGHELRPGHRRSDPQLALSGVLFGAVYLTSGRNLWVTIAAHGLLNTVRFTLLFVGAV